MENKNKENFNDLLITITPKCKNEIIESFFKLFYDSTFNKKFKNIDEHLRQINNNYIWKYSVFIFMIVGTFVINSANLFSAATAISSFKYFKISYIESIFLVGTIGTTIASFKIIDYFTQTLDLISIITVSMGTILIFNNSIKNKFSKNINTIQLIFGIFFSLLFSFLKFSFLTDYIFINSFLITFFINIITFIFLGLANEFNK